MKISKEFTSDVIDIPSTSSPTKPIINKVYESDAKSSSEGGEYVTNENNDD